MGKCRLLTRVSTVVVVVGVSAAEAHAIRPFVTDDARVVGEKLGQIETWVVGDPAILEHNVFAAIGPTDWLELTVGVVHGYEFGGDESGYGLAGPMFQSKLLLFEAVNNGTPGVALGLGGFSPAGVGAFKPIGWGTFGYIALTESLLNEDVLLHVNAGALAFRDIDWDVTPTLGVGGQVHLFGDVHAMAELYYADPYDPELQAVATQMGFRYVLSENVQCDGSFGTTFEKVHREGHGAETEQWGTIGLRLVSGELW